MDMHEWPAPISSITVATGRVREMYSHAIALGCTSVFRDPTSGKLTRIDQLSTNTATTLTAGRRLLCRNSAPIHAPRYLT
jgi:hypothetical protein